MAEGSTVYYTIDPNTISLAPSSTSANIIAAFNAWTTANKTNGSNITFVQSSGGSHTYMATIRFSSGQYTDANGQTVPNVFAFTSWSGGSATTTWYLGSNVLDTASSSFGSMVLKGQLHETGHPMGMLDQSGTPCSTQTSGQSVMNGACEINDVDNWMPTSPQSCDNQSLSSTYNSVGNGGGGGGTGNGNTQCPGTEPSCPNGVEVCTDTGWACESNTESGCTSPPPVCDSGYTPKCTVGGGWTCQESPIILDPFDDGFHITDVARGVRFRPLASSPMRQMSWPDPVWRNGWLALDRNGNGLIDDMTELFGDLTPQPPSDEKNGYKALAVFDKRENGGNENGWIDPEDSVYSHLRVWIDANHNGISEPDELHSLVELGVFKIFLRYQQSFYTDSNGNVFRYKSEFLEQREPHVCYDVFLNVSMSDGK